MGNYLQQIFRGSQVATTRHTPQGAAQPERVTGAMEYNKVPDGVDMTFQNGIIMLYGGG